MEHTIQLIPLNIIKKSTFRSGKLTNPFRTHEIINREKALVQTVKAEKVKATGT